MVKVKSTLSQSRAKMNKCARTTPAPNTTESSNEKGLTVFHGDASDALFELLVTITVGSTRFRVVLLKYRALNKRFKQEADVAIDLWCSAFQTLANAQRHAQPVLSFIEPTVCSNDDSERLLYKMQTMVRSAFGQDHMLPERHMALVSILNRNVYLHMLTRTCCLCHNPLLNDSGADLPLFNYTYAHKQCQLSHCVQITARTKKSKGDHPLQTGVSRKWNRLGVEGANVLLGCKLEGNKRKVTETRIRSKLGTRYSQFVANRNGESVALSGSLLVWLRPHPAIRNDETLYGILDIDKNTEQRATKLAEEYFCNLRERAKEKLLKKSVQRRKVQSAQVKSQIRAKLSNLKSTNTYLKSVSDVEAVHAEASNALNLSWLQNGHTCPTKNWSSALVTAIEILDETLVLLEGFTNRGLVLDWLFSHHAKEVIWNPICDEENTYTKSALWHLKNMARDIALPVVHLLRALHTYNYRLRVFDTEHRPIWSTKECFANLETGAVSYSVKILWLSDGAEPDDQVSDAFESDVDEIVGFTHILCHVTMLNRDLSMMRWGFYEALEGLSERDEIPVRDIAVWKFQSYVSALLKLATQKHLISRLHPFLCTLLGLHSSKMGRVAEYWERSRWQLGGLA